MGEGMELVMSGPHTWNVVNWPWLVKLRPIKSYLMIGGLIKPQTAGSWDLRKIVSSFILDQHHGLAQSCCADGACYEELCMACKYNLGTALGGKNPNAQLQEGGYLAQYCYM